MQRLFTKNTIQIQIQLEPAVGQLSAPIGSTIPSCSLCNVQQNNWDLDRTLINAWKSYKLAPTFHAARATRWMMNVRCNCMLAQLHFDRKSYWLFCDPAIVRYLPNYQIIGCKIQCWHSNQTNATETDNKPLQKPHISWNINFFFEMQ